MALRSMRYPARPTRRPAYATPTRSSSRTAPNHGRGRRHARVGPRRLGGREADGRATARRPRVRRAGAIARWALGYTALGRETGPRRRRTSTPRSHSGRHRMAGLDPAAAVGRRGARAREGRPGNGRSRVRGRTRYGDRRRRDGPARAVRRHRCPRVPRDRPARGCRTMVRTPPPPSAEGPALLPRARACRGPAWRVGR